MELHCQDRVQVDQIGGDSLGDTKESGASYGRKDSVKQMMSSLSAAAWIERSVRLEWRPWMFEVHTVLDGLGEELLIGC